MPPFEPQIVAGPKVLLRIGTKTLFWFGSAATECEPTAVFVSGVTAVGEPRVSDDQIAIAVFQQGRAGSQRFRRGDLIARVQ